MKITVGFLLALLQASTCTAKEISTQINQPIKYASLEEMHLEEYEPQSRYGATLSALRGESERGDSGATLELLDELLSNENLTVDDLASIEQLMAIATIQKADNTKLQSIMGKYGKVRTAFSKTHESLTRPSGTAQKVPEPKMELDYGGQTLDDISGVKQCGDANTKETVACFATFNNSLKADYSKLKSYNLAIGWNPQNFKPDVLYESARTSCGRTEYCTTIPLYLMNLTLLQEKSEARFSRSYTTNVTALLTAPLQKIKNEQQVTSNKIIQDRFEEARVKRYQYRVAGNASTDALVKYALEVDVITLERPNCTAYVNQAYAMAFDYPNDVIAERQIDNTYRSLLKAQCIIR